MSENRSSDTPVLDEWRAQVGDEAVAEAVEAARTKIADGSLPSFSDREEFLEYLRGSRRPSA